MPRIMKKRNTETMTLIKDAIIYVGNQKGATYKEIKQYVNMNANAPFVSDTKIKQSIRSSLNSSAISKRGSRYKICQKKATRQKNVTAKLLSRENPPKTKNLYLPNMRGWQTTAFTVLFVVIMFSMFTAVKAESDDDDDILGEVLIDLFTGVVLETCTESETCGYLLYIFTVAIILFGIIMTCITGECFFERPTLRDVRRGATVYGGMRLRRDW